jgi:penicillin-binding protein 1A
MPLGTSEVTVLDQATAYAVFPAGGLESRRHGISQILNYDGDILYDFARDAPAARRVLSEQAISSMNRILTQIPVIGTGRKAALSNGIVTGGKTGTTQAYRDAWFVGFTGDYTTAVWFGNDDYTSTEEMTGGSLPAMTFKRLMDYAEQGIEHRAIPGIEAPTAETAKEPEPVAAAAQDENALPPLVRPRSLSGDVTRLLKSIGNAFERASPLKPKEKVGGRVAALEAPDVTPVTAPVTDAAKN